MKRLSKLEEPTSYLIPGREGRAEIREKASRFMAFVFPMTSAEEGARVIEKLARDYHDATHVAFAWKIGTGSRRSTRASDAGEPAGTAGKPIASAIESSGLTDVGVAVVRYFGGTKLGTGGLARAYREAAAAALSRAGTREVVDAVEVVVRCGWDRAGAVRRLIRPPEVTLVQEGFDEICLFRLAVYRSRLPALCEGLDDARAPYEISPDT
jgi:uncharacterized YigZ family protein